MVTKSNAKIEAKPSHAGEPYGTVTFDNAAAEFSGASSVSAERAFELAAVMRAMQFRRMRMPGPRVARGAKV